VRRRRRLLLSPIALVLRSCGGAAASDMRLVVLVVRLVSSLRCGTVRMLARARVVRVAIDRDRTGPEVRRVLRLARHLPAGHSRRVGKGHGNGLGVL